MAPSRNTALKAAALLVAVVVVAVAGMFLTAGQGIDTAHSAVDGAAMSIYVDPADTHVCPGTKVLSETCVPLGAMFDVIVNADAVPFSDRYDGAQAFLVFGASGLTFKQSTTVWPDCEPWTDLGTSTATTAGRGCLVLRPYNVSQYKGSLFSFTFTCTPSASSHQIDLETLGGPIAGTSGAAFQSVISGLIAVPGSTLLVNCTSQITPTPTPCPAGKVPAIGGCGTPTPTPTATPTPCPAGKVPTYGGCGTPTPTPDLTDTDGDGCPDQRENGTDETLGGLRDFLDPWDYYDVETISGPGHDGNINVLFDVLGVINHYAPTGDPPYDANYDRGPSAGPNPWNMTAPDGSIDLLNDILGVIQQANDRCI